MDYKPLIQLAIKRNRCTRYKLAQELGFKKESAIYQVESGKAGLSAEKLMKLIQLAGKTLAGVAVISAALLTTGGIDDASASVRNATVRFIHYTKSAIKKLMPALMLALWPRTKSPAAI